MRHAITTPAATSTAAETRYAYALDVCRVARAEYTRLNTAETKRALDAAVAEVRAAEAACG